MDELTDSENLRIDISYVLERVGESLQKFPNHLRPLKLFAERLDDAIRGTKDPDLMFLNSYLSLFVEDLYFNLLTDVSAWPKPKYRAELIRAIGKIISKLAIAVKNNNEKQIYSAYKELGRIWTKDIPELGKKTRMKEELYPKYPSKSKRIKLPLVAERLNQFPATKHCENYLASGFKSPFHKDIDFLTMDAELAKKLPKYYISKIKKIQRKMRIDRLVFFEKKYGPIGSIAIANSIISQTGIDALYVRLRRRIKIDQIKMKGKLKPGDKLIIISDVITTGDGILKTKEMLENNYKNVEIPYAIVLYDRKQGAKKRLKQYGIEIEAIFTREDFAKKGVIDKAENLRIGEEIVPLFNEEKKELENIFGKEAVKIMEKSTVAV